MSLVETLRVKMIKQPEPVASIANSSWGSLYKIARISCFIVLAFIPLQMAVFFLWPPPGNIHEWFDLYIQYPIIGLMTADLLLIVDYVLMAIIFLALYVALKPKNPSLMLLALLLEFISVITYFSSTIAFEMLSLSQQYAAGSSEVTQAMLLAAGQSLLASWQGTAFNLSYLLGAAALLVLSLVMLRNTLFSKPIGYLTLLMGILMILPPTAGKLGMILSILSLVPTVAWLAMISRRFFSLALEEKTQ